MLDKEGILSLAKATVLQKITDVQQLFDDLSESLKSETKSTAGDKHETGRAMAQLEQEKLGTQLNNLIDIMNTLELINWEKECDKVEFGSVVKTNQGNYFISVGLGSIGNDDAPFYCISATAPISRNMLGKKQGDSFEFQGKQFEIISVD